MSDKEKLIEWMLEVDSVCATGQCDGCIDEGICFIHRATDYLIANSVTVQKHGKWEYDPNGCDWGIGAWRCSNCGCKNDALPWDNRLNPYDFACSHFCPHCGAKMDGGI